MIEYTSGDDNLDIICDGLNHHLNQYKLGNYHIFGLRQEDRPHVRLDVFEDHKGIKQLKKLFKDNGYTLSINSRNGVCCDCVSCITRNTCCCGDCTRNIGIGLRYDIRRSTRISRQLIDTIIFAFEGKLTIGRSNRLRLNVSKGTGKYGKEPDKKIFKKRIIVNNLFDEPRRAADLIAATTVAAETLIAEINVRQERDLE